jgi:CRP-like cAMP-binding protein
MSLSEGNESSNTSELDENLMIIRGIHFFAVLPLEVLKLVAYLCARENFSIGDYLFKQGDDDGQAFYIISGRARLIQAEDGSERELKDYKEGDFLGGMLLMGNMRRLFSLKASTEMACLILTREKFTKAIEQFPDIMPKIIKAVIERLSDWERRLLAEFSKSYDDCGHIVGISLI